VLDVMTLAVYCQAYSRWRIAEEALVKMGERDLLTGGLLVKRDWRRRGKPVDADRAQCRRRHGAMPANSGSRPWPAPASPPVSDSSRRPESLTACWAKQVRIKQGGWRRRILA
jgi:hypothetical protein